MILVDQLIYITDCRLYWYWRLWQLKGLVDEAVTAIYKNSLCVHSRAL